MTTTNSKYGRRATEARLRRVIVALEVVTFIQAIIIVGLLAYR